MTVTAARQRLSCDGNEGERQRWAWERGRKWLREWAVIWAELRSGLSCDGDEGERRRWESDWESEAEAESDFWEKAKCMLQTTPYRGEKEVERCHFKAETRQPFEPVTVHRTGQSDRGLDKSMLFLLGTVLHLKGPWNWTVHGFPSRIIRSGPGLTTLIFIKLKFLWFSSKGV